MYKSVPQISAWGPCMISSLEPLLFSPSTTSAGSLSFLSKLCRKLRSGANLPTSLHPPPQLSQSVPSLQFASWFTGSPQPQGFSTRTPTCTR